MVNVVICIIPVLIAVSKPEGIRLRIEADTLSNYKVPGTTMEIKPAAYPTLVDGKVKKCLIFFMVNN